MIINWTVYQYNKETRKVNLVQFKQSMWKSKHTVHISVIKAHNEITIFMKKDTWLKSEVNIKLDWWDKQSPSKQLAIIRKFEKL